MIPEKAYALAQSAGWVGIDLPAPSTFKWSEKRYEENYKRACDALTALDPAFFQALGKALGWQVAEPYVPHIVDGIDLGLHFGFNEWHVKASTFYDLILTNGDTDAFWKELLPNEEKV